MKQFGIFILLVHVVIEMFATADAKVIFSSQPHGHATVLKSPVSLVEHVQTSFEKLLYSYDTKPAAQRNCSCSSVHDPPLCVCNTYVNDASIGFKGNFTLEIALEEGTFVILLELDGNSVFAANAYITVGFIITECNLSELTKGENICFVMAGHTSKDPDTITGSAILIISDDSYFDFGCFSFNHWHANEKIPLDGSLKLFDTKHRLMDFS